MDIFMNLIGLCIFCYILFLGINNVPALKNFFKSDVPFSDLFSKDFWAESTKSNAIRKRICLTLAVVLISQVISFIPIPGVNIGVVFDFLNQLNNVSDNHLTKVFLHFSSGATDRMYIDTLGFMPYFTVVILLQLLSLVVPPLRRQFFSQVPNERNWIGKFCFINGILLCAVQAFLISLWLERQSFAGAVIVNSPGIMFRLTVVLSLTVTFCLLLWLARLITEKGIGNGIAVIVLVDMIIEVLVHLVEGVSMLQKKTGQIFPGMVYVAGIFFVFLAAFILTSWRKNISVQIKERRIDLPIRLSWTALQPIALAHSVVLIPATIASFSPTESAQAFAAVFHRGGGIAYYVLFIFTIVAFTFFYKEIVFNRNFILSLFKKYSGKLLVAESEEGTKVYLSEMSNKVALLLGFAFLFFAFIPELIVQVFRVPFFIASIFGMMSVLVIVGVMRDIAERMKALSMMEKQGCQTTCYVAGDEMEAIIKKDYLEQSGIPCIVDPIRFTWGMPIRTPIDEYRLNVPAQDVQRAQELLA